MAWKDIAAYHIHTIIIMSIEDHYAPRVTLYCTAKYVISLCKYSVNTNHLFITKP